MKALRLPICASAVAYLFRFHRPRDSSYLCVRRSAPEGWKPPPGQGIWVTGRPSFRLLHVDASRISQVSRRSLLCLCSAPRPRSNQCALAMTVTSMLPPANATVRASDDAYFGAHSRSFNTCSPTLRASRCRSRARLASDWLAGLCREGVEPSGSLRKVSDELAILPSCPPDATHLMLI
jgi:hypothetical protein